MPIKTDDAHPIFKIPPLALVAAALVLSLGGCGAGDGQIAVDQDVLDQVARAISRAEDRITAEALSERLIAGREPVALIDLRPPDAYANQHIDGARHAAITDLISADGRATLEAGAAPVLVSETGATAAQAAALLRAAGINAYVLDGGYQAWQKAMNPDTATADSPAAAAKRQAIACYFEGDYVADAGLAVKAPPAATPRSAGYSPPVAPVAKPKPDPLGLGLGLGLGPEPEIESPPSVQTKRRKLKVKEGC